MKEHFITWQNRFKDCLQKKKLVSSILIFTDLSFDCKTNRRIEPKKEEVKTEIVEKEKAKFKLKNAVSSSMSFRGSNIKFNKNEVTVISIDSTNLVKI